jgi:hypothetical protein
VTSGFDVDQWLGDTEVTEAQRDAIREADRYVQARYPDGTDYADDQEAALSAAVQVILGDSTLEHVTVAWREARRREAEARAAATGAIIASVVMGESELGVSTRTGIARDTVRKALGK